MDNIGRPFNNVNVLDPRLKVIVLKCAAADDLPNEKIKKCYICKNKGWPHESITFGKVNGMLLSTCSNETRGWIVRDYFIGQIHRHRSNKQK
jgi:hypothetical protein